ncbi:MAG TPA: ribonuclease R [Thermoanaerobaculia bacterium]|nr:ribonuclease R [Thermoanaerobaculia bacterium]
MNPSLQSLVLDLLRTRGSRLLSVGDIHQRLNEVASETSSRDDVERLIDEMERDGRIVAVRGKRFSLVEFTPYVSGKLRIHPDGHGTISPPEGEEIYVERKALRGAMNGDVVLAHVDRKSSKLRTVRGKTYRDGEVGKILQRLHRHVVGRFFDGELPFVRPFDVRLDSDIRIITGALQPRDGEMVNVEIDRYADRLQDASGKVIELLGMLGEPGVDIEVAIRKYKIPNQFPPEVLAAADSIPSDVSERDLTDRVDLRGRDIVTIDGETAKDFDDAVEVIQLENGNLLLGVHIADVSHYVVEGGILDAEALERGTSVYFPGRAVPMLPERLSNGICSLNPRVPRLTFSMTVEVDQKGRLHDPKFFKSVIQTKERMTYTDVNAILTAPTPELEERYAPVLAALHRMHALYQILRKRRQARGSIDFDLPEADVLLGEEGEIESIVPSERNVAHRLIEEFMLVANELVARHLVLSNQPGLYRIHQQPDPQKLADLKLILKEFKHTMRGNPEEIRPGELQKVLKEIVGTPEERFLTEIILRSMKRAFYSEECTGHFALAIEYYAHFTSPIRRYPDLIVHRRLHELITAGPMYGPRLAEIEARHPALALQSSEREKRAEEAEREVLEWKKVLFMRDKIGLDFTGRVTGVMQFGLFVELDEFFVQGLVPVASIGGDFWLFVEREHRLRGQASGRELRLGDTVVVEVRSIDEERRQIEFRLKAAGGVAVAPRQEPRNRSR